MADAQRQVATARRGLLRLSTLAEELLDLSRLDAAVALRSEAVELGELARAVAAEFGLRAGERDTAIEVVPPTGPSWGRGDPDAVARVVRILIDNALRYGDGHDIRVTTGDDATVESPTAARACPPRNATGSSSASTAAAAAAPRAASASAGDRPRARGADGRRAHARRPPGGGTRFTLTLPRARGDRAAEAAPLPAGAVARS